MNKSSPTRWRDEIRFHYQIYDLQRAATRPKFNQQTKMKIGEEKKFIYFYSKSAATRKFPKTILSVTFIPRKRGNLQYNEIFHNTRGKVKTQTFPEVLNKIPSDFVSIKQCLKAHFAEDYEVKKKLMKFFDKLLNYYSSFIPFFPLILHLFDSTLKNVSKYFLPFVQK